MTITYVVRRKAMFSQLSVILSTVEILIPWCTSIRRHRKEFSKKIRTGRTGLEGGIGVIVNVSGHAHGSLSYVILLGNVSIFLQKVTLVTILFFNFVTIFWKLKFRKLRKFSPQQSLQTIWDITSKPWLIIHVLLWAIWHFFFDIKTFANCLLSSSH